MSWNAEKKTPPNPRKRFLQFQSTESESSHNGNTSPDARNEAADSDDDDSPTHKQIKFEQDVKEEEEQPSTATGLPKLVEQRRRDMQEQLRDEMKHHSNPKKRTLSESDTDSSIDSEPEVTVDKNKGTTSINARLDQPINEMNKGARMLQMMGYKAGEGLGLKKQGRTEPIPMSGQRGNLGLGHKANKDLARDLDLKWDETKEVVSEHETAVWIKCNQTPPNEATLRGWMELGSVSFHRSVAVTYYFSEETDNRRRMRVLQRRRAG
jgi:hypothetical protein